MSIPVVEFKEVTKQYKRNKALDGVSLALEAGRIYGLVGNNGAGKSTLLRILSGLAFPTSGTLTLWGKSKKGQLDKQRSRIGVLIEEPVFYPELTVRQNLHALGMLKGGLNQAELDHLLELVGLTKRIVGNPRVRHLSSGQKQRLGIAMALAGNPELLILDEPMNGLDPEGVREMRGLLQIMHQEQRVTILLSSHLLTELYRLATDYIFLDQGRVLQTITAQELSGQIQSGEEAEEYFINILKGGKQ